MTGLALDYADGTLWFGSENTPNLYQYSTAGTFLSSDTYAVLGVANFGGGEFEFTTRPVPESGTLALLGIGLAGIGFSKRKKKV